MFCVEALERVLSNPGSAKWSKYRCLYRWRMRWRLKPRWPAMPSTSSQNSLWFGTRLEMNRPVKRYGDHSLSIDCADSNWLCVDQWNFCDWHGATEKEKNFTGVGTVWSNFSQQGMYIFSIDLLSQFILISQCNLSLLLFTFVQSEVSVVCQRVGVQKHLIHAETGLCMRTRTTVNVYQTRWFIKNAMIM